MEVPTLQHPQIPYVAGKNPINLQDLYEDPKETFPHPINKLFKLSSQETGQISTRFLIVSPKIYLV